MGFIQMSVGAVMSAMVSILQNDSALAMTGIMASCSITASILYTLGKKVILNKASKELIEEEEIDMINTI